MHQYTLKSKHARACVSVILLAAIASTVAGCYGDHSFTDLAVTRSPITDPTTPNVNQPITMTMIIENHDSSYSPGTSVIVRVDGRQVVSLPVDPIAGGGSRQLTTSFTISTGGSHSVSVIIDPNSDTEDSNRDNNTFIFGINVGVSISG